MRINATTGLSEFRNSDLALCVMDEPSLDGDELLNRLAECFDDTYAHVACKWRKDNCTTLGSIIDALIIPIGFKSDMQSVLQEETHEETMPTASSGYCALSFHLSDKDHIVDLAKVLAKRLSYMAGSNIATLSFMDYSRQAQEAEIYYIWSG